jgi:hypothetical protein
MAVQEGIRIIRQASKIRRERSAGEYKADVTQLRFAEQPKSGFFHPFSACQAGGYNVMKELTAQLARLWHGHDSRVHIFLDLHFACQSPRRHAAGFARGT